MFIDISIPDKKCEIVAFFKPELAAACVDIVDFGDVFGFQILKETPNQKN